MPINTSQISTISIPIKWEDNSNSTTDKLRIRVTYSLQNTAPGTAGFGNWSQQETKEYSITKSDGTYYPYYDIRIFRILTPTISSPPILACCSDNVQIVASNYGDANTFNWNIVSGGTIVSGQGTATLTIAPDPTLSQVSVGCTVGRYLAINSYKRTSDLTTFQKTARTASFTPNYSTTPPYNYICKGSSGLQMIMPAQCGISSINWVAPNCIISGQNTLTPTIIPINAVATGDPIGIYAEVSFTGGCSITTPSVSFKILDSTTAQTPQGYFTLTLINKNNENQ